MMNKGNKDTTLGARSNCLFIRKAFTNELCASNRDTNFNPPVGGPFFASNNVTQTFHLPGRQGTHYGHLALILGIRCHKKRTGQAQRDFFLEAQSLAKT